MNFRSSFSMFICCNLLSFVDGLSCFHMKDPFKWFCEKFHYVLKKIANTDDGRNRFKFELPGRTQALTWSRAAASTNSLLAKSKSEKLRGTSYMILVNN